MRDDVKAGLRYTLLFALGLLGLVFFSPLILTGAALGIVMASAFITMGAILWTVLWALS